MKRGLILLIKREIDLISYTQLRIVFIISNMIVYAVQISVYVVQGVFFLLRASI